MNQTKTQLNKPHKYVALKATGKLRIKSCSFQLTEKVDVDCFVYCTHGLRCHWINNYNTTEHPEQVTNQSLSYTKWITKKSKLHPCHLSLKMIFYSWLLPEPGASASSSIVNFGKQEWVAVLRHNIAVSKISLIAVTTNPGRGRKWGVV